MKKDIKWLKSEVEKQDIVMDKGHIYTSDLLYLIEQLDEPETLSEDWLDENKSSWTKLKISGYYIPVDKLQNLIVSKQKLPAIPKYVADWIEEERGTMSNWKLPSRFISDSKYKKDQLRYKWSQVEGNMDKFMSALINGYEVEKEPLFYAKIKGHEVTSLCYWNLAVRSGELFVSDLKEQGGIYKIKMTKQEWNELGIDDSNADFEAVGE